MKVGYKVHVMQRVEGKGREKSGGTAKRESEYRIIE